MQVRFVTVFRTALLKRRRLTRVLSTLFKALARDGSAPLGATAVTLAAWRNYCATASAPRVMGRLLCAATALPPYTLRSDALTALFTARDVVDDVGGVPWGAFRARLCEAARLNRLNALGRLLFDSLTTTVEPERVTMVKMRTALAQFPHMFCRAIGYVDGDSAVQCSAVPANLSFRSLHAHDIVLLIVCCGSCCLSFGTCD